MQNPRTLVNSLLALLLAACPAVGQILPKNQPCSESWPMLGLRTERNAVCDFAEVPAFWDIGDKVNVRGRIGVGSFSMGGPVVTDGKVLVGSNNANTLRPEITGEAGVLLCFEDRSGVLVWQATHPKREGIPTDGWPELCVASTPFVDGERVYYVSNRGELVCADLAGFQDGENDGPLQDEQYHDANDADFVWMLDMVEALGVELAGVPMCSPVGAGKLIYACTGQRARNEEDGEGEREVTTFIAVDKETGKVAWQRKDKLANLRFAQRSSPSYSVIGGGPQVVFSPGDGWCYGYEAVKGEMLWKFNLLQAQRDQENLAGAATTPVIDGVTVLVAVGGNDLEAGGGSLFAINALKRGDISDTGRLWHKEALLFGRSVTNAVSGHGLVYAVDLSGRLFCLDPQSGDQFWQENLRAEILASPMIVFGNVILAGRKGEVIVMRHAKEPRQFARIDMGEPIYAMPVAVGKRMYVLTASHLYAIEAPPTEAEKPAPDWINLGGSRTKNNVAISTLPEQLASRWTFEAPGAAREAPVIVGEGAYVVCGERQLVALDLANGKLRWKHEAGSPITTAPAAGVGLVYFGDEAGTMWGLDAATGAVKWQLPTGGKIQSSPTFEALRIFFGSDNGKLYAVNTAEGQLVWDIDLEAAVRSSPAVYFSWIFATAMDKNLYIRNFRVGEPIRKIGLKADSLAPPAVFETRVAMGLETGELVVWDWMAQKELFTIAAAAGEKPLRTGPVFNRQWLITGGPGKTVRAFKAADGESLWTFEADGDVTAAPVLVGERVFFGTAAGTLYALNVQDGGEAWKHTLESPVRGELAVGQECLVVGTERGAIHCFGAKPAAEGEENK